MTAGPARYWRPALAGAGAALLVGALGTAATDLGPWYRSLIKPAWQPPDWLFGPVWILIYALTALGGVVAWTAARSTVLRWRILTAFAVNALLNVVWSELFFRAQRPDWALVEVVALWLSIIVLIVIVAPASRAAAALLLPYLLWVTFAAILNLAVVRLNGSFA